MSYFPQMTGGTSGWNDPPANIGGVKHPHLNRRARPVDSSCQGVTQQSFAGYSYQSQSMSNAFASNMPQGMMSNQLMPSYYLPNMQQAILQQNQQMAVREMAESTAEILMGDDELKAKLAELQHESFVYKQQFEEAQEKLDEFVKENAGLKAINSGLEQQLSNKNESLMKIDKERENFLADRMKFQKENTEMKTKKDYYELEVERLVREKRYLSDDVEMLKTDLEKFKNKCTILQNQVDEFHSEKAMFALEKEKWAQDKELTMRSREWYLKEISDRDNSMSRLRLEIMNLERERELEKAEYDERIRQLNLQTETLGAAVEISEKEAEKYQQKIQHLTEEKIKASNSLQEELFSQKHLTDQYKAQIDEENVQLQSLKEEIKVMQEVLKEKEESLINVHSEAKKMAEEFSNDVAEKDLRIIHLQEELDKANELLQYGGNPFSTTIGNNLSTVSPAAAAAAELVSSGVSLTSIYAKHCKVVSELTEERAARRQLEDYVEQLVEEFRSKAPNILQFRKEYDAICGEHEELKRRLNDLYEERDELQKEKHNSERELSFTKSELLAAQRQTTELTKQVKKLLYHVEHENDSIDQEEIANDANSFVRISELHDRYMDILNQIEELKASHDDIVRKARQEQSESFQEELDYCRREVSRLKDIQTKYETMVKELEKQRDSYKAESENCDRSINRSRNRFNGDDGIDFKSRYENIQGMYNRLLEEKKIVEETLNKRTEHLNNLIAELRSTNGRLESNLDLQKKNQEMAIKKVTEYEKEMKKLVEEFNKSKLNVESLKGRLNDLEQQLKNKNDEVTRLNVSLHKSNDELYIAQNSVNKLEAQVEVLREWSGKDQRLTTALTSVENMLQSQTSLQLNTLKGQLDAITIERDNLRRSLDDSQLSMQRRLTELQRTQTDAIEAKERIAIELRQQLEEYSNLKEMLKKMTNERDELQNKINTVEFVDTTTDGLTKEVQQLRNKNLYLEKQVTEQRIELEKFKVRIEAKEKELDEIQSVSDKIETTLTTQSETYNVQQTNLKIERDELDAQLISAKQVIEELNNRIFEADVKYNEKTQEIARIKLDWSNEVCNLQNQIMNIEQQLEEKTKQFEQLLETLQTSFNEREEIQTRMRSLDEQMITSDQKIQELRNQLKQKSDEMEKSNDKHEKYVNSLKNAVAIAEKEKLRLSSEIQEYQSREREQQLLSDSLLQKIQEFTEQNESHYGSQVDTSTTSQTSGNETFIYIIDALRKSKEAEVVRRIEAEVEINRIKSQTAIDEQKIHELTEELVKLQNITEKTEEESNKKIKELMDRLTFLEKSEKRMEEMNLTLKKYNEQERQSSMKIQALEAELNQMNNVKNQLEQKVKLIEQELKNAKADLNNLKINPTESVNVSQETVAELNKKLFAVKEVARKHKKESGEKDVIITDLKKQLEELSSEKLKLESEIEVFKLPGNANTQTQMRKNLSKMITECKTYKAQVDQLTADKDKLNVEMAALTSKNTENEQKMTDLEEKNQKLDQKIVENETRINVLNSTLKKTQEKLKEITESATIQQEQLNSENQKLRQELTAANAAISGAAARKRGPPIDPYSPRDPVVPGTSKRPRIVYNMPQEPEPTPEQVEQRLIAEEDIEPDEGLENEHAPKNGNEYFPSMEQGNDQLLIHDEEMEDMPVEPSDDNFAAPSDGELNDPAVFLGQDEGDSYFEPPLMNDQGGEQEQYGQYHEEGNLPNVYGDLNEGGEEDYDDDNAEDENVEDNDDDDFDAHSNEPSEGEGFPPDQNDDDDIVVLD